MELVLTTLGLLAAITSSFAELKLMQVTFRHGARAPDAGFDHLYPNDPYLNETWFPEGWGGLTNPGKMSEYNLGEFLRHRYGKWLGDVYTKELVHFRSSDVERTKMSAQLVASALFPPSDVQRWHPVLEWQPIPIWTTPLFQDPLFYSFIMCQKYTKLRAQVEKTNQRLIQREKGLKDFNEFLSKNIGSEVTQQGAFILYNQLFGEMSHGVKLPDWTKNIFPDGELEKIAAFDYIIQSYNNELKQLNGGLWIREWLNNVDTFLNGTQVKGRKAYFYSGHEFNIAGILNALNVFQPHVPSYSSAIIFELHEEDGEFYTKVIHKNKDVLKEIEIPNCGGIYCPMKTFRELFADLIVEDPLSECEMR